MKMKRSVANFEKIGNSLLLRMALVLLTLGVVASQLPANNPITEPWIWPLPQKYQRGMATIRLSNNLNFTHTGHSAILESAIDRYRNLIYLKDDYPMIPYNWSTTGSEVTSSLETIEVYIRDWSEELDMDTDESYNLSIPIASNAIINATTVFGVIRALETISQMIQWSADHNSFVVPNAPWRITDFPKYKHRGLLVDTSRHYYKPRDMFKVIDPMSWNKMNVFHWHMLDSTAFPYVSKAYPELAEKGSYSHAHQYDEKFIRDFVKYAKERGVRVMPEIEAPGHSTSWAYGIPEIGSCVNVQPYFGFTIQPPSGQLNIASNKTREVVHTIIDEFSELFPDSWFHASGDEVIMECWTNDTRIVSHLRDRNITIMELFEEFVSDMQAHIHSHNKTVMVWQEMLLEYNFTLPADTVIQVWVGSEGVKESTRRGYKTVVSSSDYWYLDVGYGKKKQEFPFMMIVHNTCPLGKPRSNPFPHVFGSGYNHWNRVYSYDMRTNLTEAEANLLIGGEVAMWGELADETNFEAKIWPRASAFAERLWSGYENPAGEKIESADAILRLLPWRERMVLRGTMASPLNQGFCTRNPLDCFQPEEV